MAWTKDRIHETVNSQRGFFRSGTTMDVSWRIEQLKKLRDSIRSHEQELTEALYRDLGRCPAEAFFCDIGQNRKDISAVLSAFRACGHGCTRCRMA